MQRLPMKLALTASIATLLWAIPVSLDLGRLGAADPSQKIGIGLKIDTAQARVGRPATPRSAAGVARRTTRRTVAHVGPYRARPVVAGAAVAGTAVAGGAPRALCDGGDGERCGSPLRTRLLTPHISPEPFPMTESER